MLTFFLQVKHVNVLFIDNPVGTGFSYVDSNSALTKTNAEIAEDLVTFTGRFLKAHPEFKTVPLYIFSESYGGKMAAEFALVLDKVILLHYMCETTWHFVCCFLIHNMGSVY
jgi:serine carboxypeptidase 1